MFAERQRRVTPGVDQVTTVGRTQLPRAHHLERPGDAERVLNADQVADAVAGLEPQHLGRPQPAEQVVATQRQARGGRRTQGVRVVTLPA